MTTTTNINTFMTSIPWDELPKTVRDAIFVTRRLGIQYLWVDALCVIQGTDHTAQFDWRSESAKMLHIYGAAFITIAARNSANAHEGLFHKRPVAPMPSCPLRSSSKYPRTILIGPDPPSRLPHTEPLNTRAWALQEQLLSNRILAYETAGLYWMCRKSHYLETMPEPEFQALGFMEKETSPDRLDCAPNKLAARNQLSEWVRVEWKAIVENYSSRDLTYMTDKLPALYGLSEMVDRSSKDKYFAGLWQSDLLQQLLWRHCGKVTGSAVEFRRQREFRAPSWSWASVDGQVQFLHDYQGLDDIITICNLNIHTSQQPHKMKQRPLHVFGLFRKLPSIRCEYAARYYGGAERHTPWIAYSTSLQTYLDDVEALPDTSILDSPDRPKQLLNALFLFLGSKGTIDITRYGAGLILIQVDKLHFNTFRRVGVFEGFPFSLATSGGPRRGLRKGEERRWVKIL